MDKSSHRRKSSSRPLDSCSPKSNSLFSLSPRDSLKFRAVSRNSRGSRNSNSSLKGSKKSGNGSGKLAFSVATTPKSTKSRRSLHRNSPGVISHKELDVVTDNWLKALTPSRKVKKPVTKTYDRFVPNRGALNLPSSQFNITRKDVVEEAFITPEQQAYAQEMAKACGVALDKRILSFSAEPPPNEKEDLRHRYNRPLRNIQAKYRRTINQMPEKVLDAPGLRDDFYSNLLDWSSSNVVAIVLDTSVYLWNADTGKVWEFCQSDNADAITSVSWTGDGSFLAVGTYRGDTQIWDVETSSKVRSMAGHRARVGVLSWESHILSSGCRDGSIWHHDVRVRDHKIAELIGHAGEVCGLEWRSDGMSLASGANDNMVNIWDARASTPKFRLSEHMSAVKALAWCPWQLNLLATGGGQQDNKIHFWNTTTSSKLSTIDTGSQITSLIWSKEYKELLSTHGLPDNQISIWSYPSNHKITDLDGHSTRILYSAISPDAQTVATAASDENLKFWKAFESKKKPKGGAQERDVGNEDKSVFSASRMALR